MKVKHNQRSVTFQGFISFVLVMALLGMLLILTSPSAGYAAEQRVTHYHLDTGVVFIWGTLPYPGASISEASWQNDVGIGDTTRFSLSVPIGYGKEMVKAYPYVPGTISWGDLEKNRTWQHQTETEYKRTYYDQGSNSITSIQSKYNGTAVILSYSAKVDGRGRMVDVKRMLEDGQYDQLKQLCGTIPPEQEKIIKQVQAGTFGENIVGYCVFTPVIIQYDSVEEVEVDPPEKLTASLVLPKTAKAGETYIVKDVTVLPAGMQLKNTKLERKNEDGNWESVAGWDSSKLGSSIDQVGEKEEIIDYRLTVTAKTGARAVDEKSITIVDGREVSGKATLALPKYTFEGHPATAEDQSTFEVDGETYGTKRAYEEGVAVRNKFKIVEAGTGGTVQKQNQTQAKVTFPKRGNYNVNLEVRMKDGTTLIDHKSIEVRKTPTVIAALTGKQKENRKQVLNLQVATRPDQPLTELWVEISEIETANGNHKVRLIHHPDGTSNTLENSDEIKTRPLELLPSDQYFTNLKLEFLTKNPVRKTYRYTVFARDKKGDTDQVSQAFEVEADLPPEAKIDCPDQFLRNQGTNVADITASDISSTDGDQLQRIWSVCYDNDRDGSFGQDFAVPLSKMPGYKDLSFGAGTKVGFQREGVGKLQLNLFVKDVWSEETLPEYITDADYLTASAIRITEVENVAPIVSLDLLKTEKVNVLMLAGSREDAAALAAMSGELRAELLAKGLDPSIRVDQLDPPETEAGLNYQFSVNQPYGFQGAWTFLENECYAIDDHNLYTIEATFRGAESEFYPEYPYTVRAFDGESGKELWNYVIPDSSIFSISTGMGGTHFSQDDTGTYLFLVSGGRSMMIDKQNGAVLTTLPFAVNSCFLQGNILYDQQADGIYAISMETGQRTKVFSGRVSGGRRINEKVHFLTWDGNRIYRGAFDLANELTKLYKLPGTENDTPGVDYHLAGIDADGKLIVSHVPSEGRNYVRVYGRDNSLLMESNENGIAYPVTDEGGVCNYVCWSWNTRGSSGWKYNDVAVRGVYDGYSGHQEIRRKNDYPTEETVVYAKELEGKVRVVTGAMFINVYNEGYGVYPQRAYSWDFNPKTGAASNGGAGYPVVSSTVESGKLSDLYAAGHTGDNNQYYDGSMGSITVMQRWQQNMDQILSRHLNKFLSTNGEHQAVALFDTQNDESGSLEKTLSLLSQFHCDVLHISEGWANYTARIAEETGGTTLSAGSEIPGAMAGALGDAKDQETILRMKTGNEIGTLKKSFSLQPNKTYYYEYSLKEASSASAITTDDILSAVYSKAEILPSDTLGSGRYKVVDSFSEDFNDSDLESYFTMNPGSVSGGWYRGAVLSGKTSKNRYRTAAGSVSFTIPEGMQAVLSFDYDLDMDGNQMWMANGFWIDGVPWKQFMPSSMKGHYTHPDLLGPGSHTVEMRVGEYNDRFSCYTIMDNLQVALVKPGSGMEAIVSQTEASVNKTEDGWFHVNGSIRTPGKTVAYHEMPGEYIRGGFGSLPDSSIDTSSRNRTYASYKVPDGKTAVAGGLDISIYPGSGNASVLWNGYTWRGKEQRYAEDAQSNIVGGYRIPFPAFSGAQSYTAQGSDRKGAWANLGALEAYLVDRSNSLIDQRHYFVAAADTEAPKKMYLENEVYDGNGELSLSVSAGKEYLLKDLKFYSIENGRKAYLTENAIPDSGALAKWENHGVEASVIRQDRPEDEWVSLVYKKGELVKYNIFYSDYENDPSKKQYWRYTHTPFNDGPHPEAAVILDRTGQAVSTADKVLSAPIERFYVDGKYTVEHWQEDNTTRPTVPAGNPDYDKLSNVESITFYVLGGGTAPWINRIRTNPVKVKDGDSYRLEIEVDDAEKDELSLTTELYQGGKLIYTHQADGLAADSTGKYPAVVTDQIPKKAVSGNYEVVCTVWDWSGAGLGNYRFTVVSEGKITGWVNHTAEWDRNRKKYNLKKFDTEFDQAVSYENYRVQKAPRKRGINVFWSGEEFALKAAAAGQPGQVKCEIKGTPFQCVMKKSGERNGKGETVYTGTIWNPSMINRWGKKAPEELLFHFTAQYKNGSEKNYDVKVILDTSEDYWKLHRYF